jgi:hypothetical protein
MALKTVINDEKVVSEAVKQYQLGRAQDLAYAESMLSNGAAFNMVDKTIQSNIKRRAASRPQWDTKLRKALIKNKGLPDAKHCYEAHHIVAKGAQRARAAVDVLLALGIDIDDPENGVFLPKDEKSRKSGSLKKSYIHGNVHTKPYYANINFQIVSAYENGADSEEMKRVLKDIGEDLQKGVYPVNQYLPGAEVYA